MKTPYDAAQRLRQRELDAVASAIREQASAREAFARQHAGVVAKIAQEAELASGDVTLASPGWQRRMREQRATLAQGQHDCEARLDTLRTEAIDVYGGLRAVETAADGFRAEVERRQAVREQGENDDRSASAFLRNRRERLGGNAS